MTQETGYNNVLRPEEGLFAFSEMEDILQASRASLQLMSITVGQRL
jgi:hypothetical protein